IAAVHGHAAGSGCEMALLCDFRIAASDTRLSLPETGLGMIPGVVGTQTAPRAAGLGRALDLVLTGRTIDARLAQRVGMVGSVVPGRRLGYGDLLGRIRRLAGSLKKLGVSRGDAVAALDTNSDAYVATYYAAATLGAVFVPLNYRAKPPELEYMISTAKVRSLFVGGR